MSWGRGVPSDLLRVSGSWGQRPAAGECEGVGCQNWRHFSVGLGLNAGGKGEQGGQRGGEGAWASTLQGRMSGEGSGIEGFPG